MAKLKEVCNPIRSTFAFLLTMCGAVSLAQYPDKGINYIFPLSIGGTLGLIALLIEFRKNNINREYSEFKVGMLPYNILLVVALLGALGPQSQEGFFMIIVIGILLALWIALLVIQFRYKRKVIWE